MELKSKLKSNGTLKIEINIVGKIYISKTTVNKIV